MEVINTVVPQTALEKLYQKWDPRKYDLVSSHIPGAGTIVAGANATGQTTNIQVAELSYVFGLRSQAVVTATGVLPSVLYRIGFKAQSGGEDWTNGQWMAPMITGDKGNSAWAPFVWDVPRVLLPNETVVVTVDNNTPGNVAITVDVGLFALIVRQRRSQEY